MNSEVEASLGYMGQYFKKQKSGIQEYCWSSTVSRSAVIPLWPSVLDVDRELAHHDIKVILFLTQPADPTLPLLRIFSWLYHP